MQKDEKEYLELVDLPDKETYNEEEKQMIMRRINDERLMHQGERKKLDGKIERYSEEEKSHILVMLNEQRLSKQKAEEIRNKRTLKKEKYTFFSKEFYKFTNMEREYYIEVGECDSTSSRPRLITLYYRTFQEFKKKDVLMKTEVYSEHFFISYHPIRVYFKAYRLEDER